MDLAQLAEINKDTFLQTSELAQFQANQKAAAFLAAAAGTIVARFTTTGITFGSAFFGFTPAREFRASALATISLTGMKTPDVPKHNGPSQISALVETLRFNAENSRGDVIDNGSPVSYTHLTLPTTERV